jgi:hypothetical protein
MEGHWNGLALCGTTYDFDLFRPKCVLEQSCANGKTGSIARQGGGGCDSLRYLHAERTPDQPRTASPTRGFQTRYIYL